ncbi:MAG: DUF4160 domain-containing protein [Armatimonadota bacterium]
MRTGIGGGQLFYGDHHPPHFHAVYGEFEITVGVDDGMVRGEFPRRALVHVLEWYQLRRAELQQNWELARERRPLRPIAPLE